MDIKTIYGLKETTGDVGVEIEVEGTNLPNNVEGYRREFDGSLRGESAEYVFNGPVPFDQVDGMIGRLATAYKEQATVILPSTRTSTHVHLNVQSWSMTRVMNLVTLYAIFEEYLVKYCGESREGNLFCLRIRDAEAIIHYIRDAIRTRAFFKLSSDRLRYAAINVNALAKYGSVEFRAMRGTGELEEVKEWVGLLHKLYDAAGKFKNPHDIIEAISAFGPKGLAQEVFGDALGVFLYGEDWENVVFANMQECQELAFACDWDELELHIKEMYTPFEVKDEQVAEEPVVNKIRGHRGELVINGEGVHIERPFDEHPLTVPPVAPEFVNVDPVDVWRERKPRPEVVFDEIGEDV